MRNSLLWINVVQSKCMGKRQFMEVLVILFCICIPKTLKVKRAKENKFYLEIIIILKQSCF